MELATIYEITVKGSNKRYFGRTTVPIEERLRGHFRKNALNLPPEKATNPMIQNAIRKYGKEAFEIRRICWVPKNKMVEMEQKFLDRYYGTPGCMNLNPSASTPCNKGRKHTKKARESYSKAAKKRGMPRETIEAARKANTGKPSWHRKLTMDQANEIRELYSTGEYYQRSLAKMFGVSQRTVCRIVRNEIYI